MIPMMALRAVLGTESGFRIFDLLVAGGRDDGGCTSSFGKDESRQRNTSVPINVEFSVSLGL
jgi:hypothetical protein